MASRKYMVPIDLNFNELRNGVAHNLAADPAEGDLKSGLVWFNTTEKKLKIFNGEEIEIVGSGNSLEDAITRAEDAAAAGTLVVAGGADKTVKDYDGGAGLIKSDEDGLVSPAVEGEDYVTEDSENVFTNKTFDAGDETNLLTNVDVSHFDSAALATDLSEGTASHLATADVIKAYIDNVTAGTQKFLGGFDASDGDLPSEGSGDDDAIVAGDYWRVSVEGDIEGLGHLELGDVVFAAVDGASDDEDFFVLQANITDAITSDGTVSVAGNLPVYDDETGRVLTPTNVAITENGSLNLEAGQKFLVDGEQHKHSFDDLIDVQEAEVDLDSLISAAQEATHKKVVEFDNDSDWAGSEAPYAFTISQETHGLAEDNSIMVTVRDTNGAVLETSVTVDQDGDVTIQSHTKFAGSAILIG